MIQFFFKVIKKNNQPLLVFPGCDDSLPVRDLSVGWSSLLQLGCLQSGRKNILKILNNTWY